MNTRNLKANRRGANTRRNPTRGARNTSFYLSEEMADSLDAWRDRGGSAASWLADVWTRAKRDLQEKTPPAPAPVRPVDWKDSAQFWKNAARDATRDFHQATRRLVEVNQQIEDAEALLRDVERKLNVREIMDQIRQELSVIQRQQAMGRVSVVPWEQATAEAVNALNKYFMGMVAMLDTVIERRDLKAQQAALPTPTRNAALPAAPLEYSQGSQPFQPVSSLVDDDEWDAGFLLKKRSY